MKKIIFLFLTLLLTGCYSYHELSNISLVKGVSIDIEDDNYVLNYVTNDNKILEGKGKSIAEAVKNIASEKNLYIGHITTCIIGESAAKKGLNKIIDFFLRSPSSKKTFELMITKDKAKDILNKHSPNNNSYLVDRTLLSFIKDIKDEGIEPTINGINKEAKIDNIALFKDDKFIKWKNDEINELALLLNQSKYETNIITKNGNISFKMNDIKIKKSFNNTFTYEIVGKTTIDEMTSNYDLTNSEYIKSLEKILIDSLKTKLDKIIYDLKKDNLDYLGIGNYIYKNNYNKWLKIKDNYLSKIDVKFEIKPNLLKEENRNKGINNE